MTGGERCPNCGAATAPQQAACRFCGAEVPRPGGAGRSGRDDVARRLAAVTGHPRFAELMTRRVSGEWVVQRLRRTAWFGLAFAGSAGVMLVLMCGFSALFGGVSGAIAAAGAGLGGEALGPHGAGGPAAAGGGTLVGGGVFAALMLVFGAMPFAFVCVGLVLVRRSRRAAARFAAAPLLPAPAYVSDERAQVSGGRDAPVGTAYRATLQFVDGSRTEYTIPGRLAGVLERGDVGVAYTKGSYLLDFERLAV